MIHKLKVINRTLTKVMYQLAVLAERYDERMVMIVSQEFIDKF